MRGFTLLGKEFSAIVKNKKLLIPIIAVLFIPILYSGMFLWAFWDPYKSLDELPVAVVNMDKGATYEGKKLEIGDELVDKLKENPNFKWDFVSEKKGKEGLENRKYYMMVRIPENFSANATTLLNEKPKHLELEYIPNESYNFLSSQIGGTAIEKIKGEVSATLTEAYAEQMFDSIKEISDGLAQAGDGAIQLNEGSTDAKAGADQIRDNLKLLAEKSITFENGLNSASEGAVKVKDGLHDLSSGLGQLKDAQGQLYQGAGQIQGGINQVSGGLNQSLLEIDKMSKGISQLMKGSEDLANGSGQLATGATGLNKGAIDLANGIKQLNEKLQPILHSPVLTEEQKAELIKSLEALIAGSQQVAGGTGMIADNAGKLKAGAEQLHGGQSQLADGVKRLTAGQQMLANGASRVEQGQNEFMKNFQLFGSKLGEAQSGANQLASGSAALSSGLGQLSSGSAQMVDGVGKLADGSSDLADGIGKISDGTDELANKLNDAAKETGEVKGDKDKYNMFAQPVEVKTNKFAPVPNYGTGFTPYFLSLGLFVGALLISIVFPLRETVGTPKSGFSWFISKYGVLLGVGFIQSLVADAVLLMALDIKVESIPLFMLFSFITSVAFLSLVQFLVTAFGDAGRFLAIITLILQLTTSAGTFPLELIPKPLQIFNAWLPMTYSVSGFKAVISSGDFGFMWQNVGILLVFIGIMVLGTIATLTVIHKRYFGRSVQQGTTAEM